LGKSRWERTKYYHRFRIYLYQGNLPWCMSRPHPARNSQNFLIVCAGRYIGATTAAERAKSYIGWIRRSILFHGKRHPDDMGEAEISQFLTHLAVDGKVSASTQNRALCALVFLYQEVLRSDLEWVNGIVRVKRPTHLPVELSRAEAAALLKYLQGVEWLMASLLYGTGLRLLECCRLRIKDVEFSRREITIRDGKGNKDRVTLLPNKALNQAIRRNADRFPPDFMFRLTKKEKQEVVTNCDHLQNLKFSPVNLCVFTEHGAIMAASVLNSPKAIEVSVFIVRAFVRL
jgi:integrase